MRPIARPRRHLRRIAKAVSKQGSDEITSPIVLPSDMRIELIADMKRAVMDCRSAFGYAADPVGTILDTLLLMCPDPTAEELKHVLRAGARELLRELTRLRCWHLTSPTESELAAWAVLAKRRIMDLTDSHYGVDLFLAERHARKQKDVNLPREVYPVVYKPRALRADSPEQLARDPSEVRSELRAAVARLRTRPEAGKLTE